MVTSRSTGDRAADGPRLWRGDHCRAQLAPSAGCQIPLHLFQPRSDSPLGATKDKDGKGKAADNKDKAAEPKDKAGDAKDKAAAKASSPDKAPLALKPAEEPSKPQ